MVHELQCDASAFRSLHNGLQKKFPEEYGLPRRLVDLFCECDKTFTLEQLGQRASAWCPLQDRSGLPADTFEKLAMNAIALIRGAAIYLRMIGKNSAGYTITCPPLDSSAIVRWECEPSAMDVTIAAV